jgi:hypothetical protein
MTLKHPDANTKPGTKLRRVSNRRRTAERILSLPVGETCEFYAPCGTSSAYFTATGTTSMPYEDFEIVDEKRYVALVDGQYKSGPYGDREFAEAEALQYAQKYKQNNYEVAELNVVSRIVPAPAVTHSIERLDE